MDELHTRICTIILEHMCEVTPIILTVQLCIEKELHKYMTKQLTYQNNALQPVERLTEKKAIINTCSFHLIQILRCCHISTTVLGRCKGALNRKNYNINF